MSPGRYQINETFGMVAGQTPSSLTWNVYARLAEGVYAEEPVRFQSNPVTAAPGDKVEVKYYSCGVPSANGIAFIPGPPTISVVAIDGNGQRAVPLEEAEKPLKVHVTSSDPSLAMGVSFEVISAPPGAKDYSVSGGPVGADGTASAVMVVGDVAGDYVVRAKGQDPEAISIAEALFTTTAVVPSKVAIVKDTTDPADLATAYAVSASAPTTFHAIGLDGGGQKIGPMRCSWSTSAKGNPSTRGEGTLDPVADVRSSTFQPTKPGKLKLSAKSSLKGVSDGAVELFVTSLYVSVQNTFDVNNPVDDVTKFVPGMYLDGTNVALDVMETTGQFISLHLITGGAKGKATFTVDSTNYPGIAMNYPLSGDATEDMMFVNGEQSITVDFNTTTGDTWTTLLIRDYGARVR